MNELIAIIADDRNLIPYRKELNVITGSVTATILLQQIIYWAKNSNFEPFYKFVEPCENEKYKVGDSWTEELGFTKKEFANAYKKLENLGIVSKKINMSRVTFYTLNLPILSKLLKVIYVSDQKALMQVTKGDLDNRKTMLPTETTTETTHKSKEHKNTHIPKQTPTPTKQTTLPVNIINFYKQNISKKQEKIKEQKSFNLLLQKKEDLPLILVGLKNYKLSIAEIEDEKFIKSLNNFVEDKIYLDFQETKALKQDWGWN